MKLVIDIPKELYDYMQSETYDKHLDRRFDYRIRFAVKDGIPLPKGHGWIPVSERLPEECTGVLVYCPENYNIFLAYLKHGKWYIFSPHGDESINEPIVAWMPLPEPYKTESEEKE